jgi:hypothetical protein
LEGTASTYDRRGRHHRFRAFPALASKLCEWEVEEADQLNKRLIPIVCAPLGGVSVPPRLADLNYIYFYPVRRENHLRDYPPPKKRGTL